VERKKTVEFHSDHMKVLIPATTQYKFLWLGKKRRERELLA
jgi:hypothetical protein